MTQNLRFYAFRRSVIEVRSLDGVFREEIPILFLDSHKALKYSQENLLMTQMKIKYGENTALHYRDKYFTSEEAKELKIRSRILPDWEFAANYRKRGWGKDKLGITVFEVQ